MSPGAVQESTQSLAQPDWIVVGLVLAIVGSFFLANAILFRHPRSLVREHFGAAAARLRSIREYIFHRLQIHLGFLFLMSGLGMQLYGQFHPAPPGSPFPTKWVGVIVLTAVVLEITGWWLSHRLFRGYVREYFVDHPVDLGANMPLARELGALFGIESSGDDTVQSYVARLRRQIGLPAPEPIARDAVGVVDSSMLSEEELG